MIEINLLHYFPMGWLPSATREGKQVYRGEYHDTPEAALEAAKSALNLK